MASMTALLKGLGMSLWGYVSNRPNNFNVRFAKLAVIMCANYSFIRHGP
jgi:hypothetical protein